MSATPLLCVSYQDIKRIAQSLSKAMKSPLPALELRPGQPADINTLLSLVEDIIRKQNRVGGEFYSDVSKKDGAMILTLGAVNLQGKEFRVSQHSSILFSLKSLYQIKMSVLI